MCPLYFTGHSWGNPAKTIGTWETTFEGFFNKLIKDDYGRNLVCDLKQDWGKTIIKSILKFLIHQWSRSLSLRCLCYTFVTVSFRRSNNFMEHFKQNKTERNYLSYLCLPGQLSDSMSHSVSRSFLFLVSLRSSFPPLFPVLLHVFISLLLLSKSPLSFSLLPLFSHTSPLISSFFLRILIFFALFNFPPFSCLVRLPLFRSVCKSLPFFSKTSFYPALLCFFFYLFLRSNTLLLIMKTYWEVCTGGGTSAAVLWGMGKVTLCRE